MSSSYTRRAVGSIVTNYNGGVTASAPGATQTDDLLVLFAWVVQGTYTPPVVPGYQHVVPSSNWNCPQLGIYLRKATGSDDAVIPNWGPQFQGACIVAYDGPPATLLGIVHNYADVKGNNTYGDILTNYAALTITQPGSLVIAVGARNKTSATDGTTFTTFNGGSFTNQYSSIPTGATIAAVYSDWIQTTPTNVAANNDAWLQLRETVTQGFQGAVLALMPDLSVSGSGASAQGESASGTGTEVISGSGSTSESETISGIQATSGPGASAESQTTSGTGSVPVPNAGSWSILGGMPDNLDSTTLTIRALYSGALIDQTVFVTKAKAGTTGPPGAGGAGGSSAVSLSVSNPTFMIMAYAEGTPVDPTFAGIGGTATVLDGPGNDVTRLCSFSVVATGCTGAINNVDNVPFAAHPMGYYGITAMSANYATLEIDALYKGYTYKTTVKLAKALGGYQIVTSLPNSNLFDGRVVYLTTDGKLYRFVAGKGWTAAVPALDISGLLSAAQIASLAASQITGALTDAQIASINAAKLAGYIQGSQIAAGTIVAGNIAAGAITTPALAAGSVTSAAIAAGTIQAGDIAAGTITGNKIAANTLAGTNILGGTITGDKMDAGAIITASAQITDGVIINAKIGDLEVNSAKIADLTVGTTKITDFAISRAASAVLASDFSGNGTYAFLTLSFTPDTTSPIYLDFLHILNNTNAGVFTSGAEAQQCRLTRVISGAEVTLQTLYATVPNGGTNALLGKCIDAAGVTTARTYKLYTSWSDAFNVSKAGCLIIAQEMKK